MSQNDAWAAHTVANAVNAQTSLMLQRERDRLEHEREMRRIEDERVQRRREEEHIAMWRGFAQTSAADVAKQDAELTRLRRRLPAIEQAAVQALMRQQALREALLEHIPQSEIAVLDEALEVRLAGAMRDPEFISRTRELGQARVDLLLHTPQGGAR